MLLHTRPDVGERRQDAGKRQRATVNKDLVAGANLEGPVGAGLELDGHPEFTTEQRRRPGGVIRRDSIRAATDGDCHGKEKAGVSPDASIRTHHREAQEGRPREPGTLVKHTIGLMSRKRPRDTQRRSHEHEGVPGSSRPSANSSRSDYPRGIPWPHQQLMGACSPPNDRG